MRQESCSQDLWLPVFLRSVPSCPTLFAPSVFYGKWFLSLSRRLSLAVCVSVQFRSFETAPGTDRPAGKQHKREREGETERETNHRHAYVSVRCGAYDTESRVWRATRKGKPSFNFQHHFHQKGTISRHNWKLTTAKEGGGHCAIKPRGKDPGSEIPGRDTCHARREGEWERVRGPREWGKGATKKGNWQILKRWGDFWKRETGPEGNNRRDKGFW